MENHYRRQPEMMTEYAEKVLSGRVRRGGILGCILLAFIVIASAGNGDYISAAVLGICFLIPILTVLMAKKLTVRELFKKEEQLHKGNTDYETHIRFGDKIQLEEDGYTVEFDYDDVIAVYHMERSSALMVSKTNGILVAADGFRGGKRKDFYKLMEKCCRRAKIKEL